MTEERLGRYADGRTYVLPAGWEQLDDSVLEVALERTRDALTGPAADRLRRYYDPHGNYAGALMSELEPNPADEITPADLLAVSMLSMRIEPAQTRMLLDPPSPRRGVIRGLLRQVPLGLPITSLDAEGLGAAPVIGRMWDLYREFRSLMSDQVPDTNRWVFAAKMCARKRPWLYPVRDNEVCRYLSESGVIGKRGMGNFGNDIQVFAFLMSVPDITTALGALRDQLSVERFRVDATDLRLLDVALWMAATRA